MSPPYMAVSGHGTGFPRVSGDEPNLSTGGVRGGVFSPRERG